ncbi:MAG: transposase [Candidatus Omnitrophota bacterium]
MPRQARLDYAGALHHVIGRGIDGLYIFKSKRSKQEFHQRLRSLLKESSLQIYAWSIMGNHFHLLLQTGKTSLSEFMRKLLTGYAIYYNKTQKRKGYVFQNRYKSILCEKDEYLLPLIRYIHLNPVKAKIVEIDQLEKYPWTSHGEITKEKPEALINRVEVLSYFGNTKNKAKICYEKYVKEGLDLKEDYMGGGLIRSLGGLKESFRISKEDRQTYDERILGSGQFVEHVLKDADQEEQSQQVFKDMNDLLNRTVRYYKVKKDDILYSRTKPVREARCVVIFLANQYLKCSATKIGSILRMKQAASSIARTKGQKAVEKKGLLKRLTNYKH